MESGVTSTQVGRDEEPLRDDVTRDTPERRSRVAALLLSGGASRRMGRDKTLLIHEGRTLAQRTAHLLTLVVDLAIEIGPGRCGVESFQEDPPGQGPLAAIATGRRILRQRGHEGPALVLACDMPLLNEDVLRFLVDHDAPGSVVPVVDGRSQPLCARWSGADLDAASDRYSRGERSLRFLTGSAGAVLLDESQWGPHASRTTFTDVDTPEDARRLGLLREGLGQRPRH